MNLMNKNYYKISMILLNMKIYKKTKKGGSIFKNFIYKNLGRNLKVHKPRIFTLVKNVIKSAKQNNTKIFLKIEYNYRLADAFYIKNNIKVFSDQVKFEPNLLLQSSARHLLILYDIDYINKNNKQQPYLNWCCTILNNTKSGISIINYEPPNPIFGTHKYIFELYLYPKELNFKTLDSNPNNRNQSYIDVKKFIIHNNLIKRLSFIMNVTSRKVIKSNLITFFGKKH